MRGALAAAVAVAAALVSAPPAFGQARPMSPRARERLEEGLRDYQSHAYSRAIAAFEAGYEIDPRPEFLYARAQAERMRGDCQAAIATYRAFLETQPAPDPASAAEVQIERCRQTLGPSVADVPARSPALEPRPSRWWADELGGIFAGGAVATFVLATGFFLAGEADADGANHAPTSGSHDLLAQAAADARLVGTVALAAGAAFLAGAVLRYATRPGPARSPSLAARPGGLAVVVWF